MTEHTPGPWHYRRNAGEHPSYSVYGKRRPISKLMEGGSDWRDVAVVLVPVGTRAQIEESRANARLIIAAPMMYEALIDTPRNEDPVTFLRTWAQQLDLNHEPTAAKYVRKLAAAIAKARGEDQ